MKIKLITCVLLLVSVAKASQLDSKSLFIGVGLGLGTYASRNYIAKPVASASVKAAKKTAHATKYAVTFGKKK